MKKNRKLIILPIIIIAVLAIIALAILSKIMRRIPSNDISVTGNTAGNLNNHGRFCEQDGKIYFSNAYDNGCLYSMDLNESNMTKLVEGNVSLINAGGNFIYYYLNTSKSGTGFGYVLPIQGIYRIKKNGKDSACLVRDGCTAMQLVGDYIYYERYNNEEYSKFHKVKTDKSEDVLLSNDIINPSACNNGIIYFNGQSRDHYLYALDTRNDSISTVYQGDLWFPVYKDGYIYYMDVSSKYRLCRYSLSGNTVEILTNDRVDGFNVGNFYIYYQKNDRERPALMRMALDGSNPEIVAEGNFENISITSYYTYFNEFGLDTPVYRTPTDGAVDVSEFTAARDGVQK